MHWRMLKKSFKIDNLYNESLIFQMIEDFSEFLIVYNGWFLHIEGETDEEIMQVFWECMNYVIALYNETI